VSNAAVDGQTGPGSVAGFGQRFLAFLIDGALADLIALAVNGGYHVGSRQNLVSYLAFLGIELLGVGLLGQTPGMRLLRIGVARADRTGRAAFGWIVVRTALLAAVVPALITDSSGRAMHDRAAGTVTLRTG
jgi:uncharacterized RDD family membrane protein YckC